MNFKNPYWSNRQKAQMLQRWIIVHSILYYELGESVVSDKVFDDNSRQLVELMQEMSQEDLKRTRYWYMMRDFDGSTGFDLPSKLSKEDGDNLRRDAFGLLKLNKGEKQHEYKKVK